MLELPTGTRVEVRIPFTAIKPIYGTVLEGPNDLRGRTIYKVAVKNSESWLPSDWLKPALHLVPPLDEN